jgi:hypothetical protein
MLVDLRYLIRRRFAARFADFPFAIFDFPSSLELPIRDFTCLLVSFLL